MKIRLPQFNLWRIKLWNCVEPAPTTTCRWPEIDRALTLASHQIKLIIMERGTLDPSPGP